MKSAGEILVWCHMGLAAMWAVAVLGAGWLGYLPRRAGWIGLLGIVPGFAVMAGAVWCWRVVDRVGGSAAGEVGGRGGWGWEWGIRGGGASDGARGRARSPSDGARGRARSPSDGARGGRDGWLGVREAEREFLEPPEVGPAAEGESEAGAPRMAPEGGRAPRGMGAVPGSAGVDLSPGDAEWWYLRGRRN